MKKRSFAGMLGAVLTGVMLGLILAHIPSGRAQFRNQRQSESKSAPTDESTKSLPPAEVSGSFAAYRPDPAFERHLDLALVAKAVHDADPALLTDAALQLADGERILQRPHKELPTGGLMRMACRSAAERGDKASLDRLAKAGQTCGDKQLVEKVATARKTTSSPRSPRPALMVSLEETPAETFALYQGCLRDIRSARLVGDKRMLKALTEAVPEMPLLSKEQKNHLADQMKAAAAVEPDEKQAQKLCLKLLHASRCDMLDPGCGNVFSPRTVSVLGQLSAGSRDLSAAERAKAGQLARKLHAASRCDIGDPTCVP